MIQVEQLLLPRFDEQTKLNAAEGGRLLARGLPASPGAAVGRAILDADKAEATARSGERVILVRPETSPDDFHGMSTAQGILTARGGMTSHAAVVARGKVMRVDGQTRQGVEFVSLADDGADMIRCFVGATGAAPPAG